MMFARKQQQAAVESVVLDLEERSCAWCLKEQGLPMGNGSHGICKRHGNEWMAAAQKALQQRREARAK